MMRATSHLLPCPFSPDFPLNKGNPPIYVYDTAPVGGGHFSHARVAQRLGAAVDHRSGRSGHSYGIPTTGRLGPPLPWPELKAHIKELGRIAADDPEHGYLITKIGGARSSAYINERQVAEAFIEYDPGNFQLPGTWERQRHPKSRRIVIASALSNLGGADLAAIRWVLQGIDGQFSEILIPGIPMRHEAALEARDALRMQGRLIASGDARLSTRAEGLAWYADTALLIKPSDEYRLAGTEAAHARRLKVFYRAVVENHLAHRAIIAGEGPPMKLTVA